MAGFLCSFGNHPQRRAIQKARKRSGIFALAKALSVKAIPAANARATCHFCFRRPVMNNATAQADKMIDATSPIILNPRYTLNGLIRNKAAMRDVRLELIPKSRKALAIIAAVSSSIVP